MPKMTQLMITQLAMLLKRAALNSGLLENSVIRRRLDPRGYSYKRMLLKDLAIKFECRNFVETGTYYGETSLYMSRHVENVLTCEPSDYLYSRAINRFRSTKNIRMWNAPSEKCFGEMVNHLEGNTLFWLDGHFSGGITELTIYCPIFFELKELRKRTTRNDVIVIDDMRLFGGLATRLAYTFEDGYPELQAVVDALGCYQESHQLKIAGDCMVCMPRSLCARESEAKALSPR